MTITQQIFNYWCSSAQNPIGDYGIWDSVQGHLQTATAVLVSSLGSPLYDSLTDEAVEDVDDPLHATAVAAQRFVCLDTYDRAIPHLDLTLSSTGFGVVSNANVAPASADRVERLRKEVSLRKSEAFDDLLDSLRGNPAWCGSDLAKSYFSTLVWRCSQLAKAGYPDADRRQFSRLFGAITKAQADLCHMLSPDQVGAWTEAVRTDAVSSPDAIAIDLAVAYICAVVGKMGKDAVDSSKASLMAYVEAHVEHFAEYRNSSAYTANHYQPYQNRKDDTSYFFG